MKKSELVFSLVQVFLDLLMIWIGAVLAFELRTNSAIQDIINRDGGIVNFTYEQYKLVVLIILPVFILVYTLEGLYKIKVTRKFFSESYSVFRATTLVLVIVIVGFFLQRDWFSSRFVIVMAWFLIFIFVTLGRSTVHLLQRKLLIWKGIGFHKVLVIGLGEKVGHICKTIKQKPQLGYKMVGYLEFIDIKKVKEIKNEIGIDEIIIYEDEMPDDLLLKLYDFCEINNITYKLIPSLRQSVRLNFSIFDGEPIIEINHTLLDGWGKIAKRFFDVVGSSVLIILTFPVMLVIAILIKIEDPKGPIIFKNSRVGANGKKIFVYKFRYFQWKWCTTKKNPNYDEAIAYEQELIKKCSIKVGPLYKIANDPRRTKVGKILEKFSLDELPQFFNVFLGAMSLVGPRPHQEREVNKYSEYHRRLLTITPGITGMAQVSGRSDLSFEDEYKLDVYYIENWSLLLDFVIMLKTPFSLLKVRENNKE